MQIFVETTTDKIITLEVEASDTIKIIKFKIQDKIRIPHSQQQLTFASELLQDSYPVSHYNIEDGSRLFVHNRMQVILKIHNTGKTTVLEVEASDTIECIKAKIFNKEGIPLDHL